MSNILWIQPSGILALTSVFEVAMTAMSASAKAYEEAANDAAESLDVPLLGVECIDPPMSARQIKDHLGHSLAEYAEKLQARGDVPSNFQLAAFDVEWNETGWPHEAHRWHDNAVVVDIAAAKEITRDRLREERAPLLSALDLQFMQALEKGGDTTAIVAEKQRLRDITNQVDSCTTLDGLKALSCKEVSHG